MSTAPPSHALPPILIAGPTASGKSRLAVALARRENGVVINADSMQVYRELRILTARPDAGEEAAVPHRLYGHVPARDAYSVGQYVRDVQAALQEAQQRGLRPILVGGTGLYFKALREGLSPIPEIAPEVRAFWRAEGERRGARILHAMLAARDATMAERLSPSDTQRIVRALEVLESTGTSLAEWQMRPGVPVLTGPVVALRIACPRAQLYAQAEARFEAMMAHGALEEVAALAALGLSPELPALRALGVAPLMAALRGDITVAEAVAQAKTETRQYIKRQETWLRRYMMSWTAIDAQQMESLATSGLSNVDLLH